MVSFLSSSVIIVLATSLGPSNVIGQSCSAGTLTPTDHEGPFYIPGSPVRDRLAPEDQLAVTENVLYIEGTVYGNDCIPMDTVLIEPWYAGIADEEGNAYSAAGSDLDYRGQILTDSCGRYSYTQTFPESYTGRPIRHVHVAVSTQDSSSRLLTTQMYFKDDPSNTFSKTDLQMREVVTKGDGSRSVVFNMFLDTPGTGDAASCGGSTETLSQGVTAPSKSPVSEVETSNSPVAEAMAAPSASPGSGSAVVRLTGAIAFVVVTFLVL